MTSVIFSSVFMNITAPLTLSVKKEGDCYATLQGEAGKFTMNVNIFDSPLIYFALANIKKNSCWQIKGDQIIKVDKIHHVTITSFTLQCKSIAPVPYLDNNGNWVTSNVSSRSSLSPLSSSSFLSSLLSSSSPLLQHSSSSPTSSPSSPSSTSSSSSSLFYSHSREHPLTSISRDAVPRKYDRMFTFLIYHILMDNSNPLHNDFIIDWEDEQVAKRAIQEKLDQFRNPNHYSYVPDDLISIIDPHYAPSIAATPTSSSSSCSSLVSDNHRYQRWCSKRCHSEINEDNNNNDYHDGSEESGEEENNDNVGDGEYRDDRSSMNKCQRTRN